MYRKGIFMQINAINNINFGLLSPNLELKMKNAILHKNFQKDMSKIKKTKAYQDFRYIINHTKDSYLQEYNICDKVGTIYDLRGKIKSIDISKAYKEKDETSRYLAIIRIIANFLR